MYDSCFKTNYFRAKNVDSFRKFIKLCGCELIERDGLVGCGGKGKIPSIDMDDFSINFIERLSKHLVLGEVAVIMEVGHENGSLLEGCAYAVNSSGETRSIYLDSIFDLAKELKNEVF